MSNTDLNSASTNSLEVNKHGTSKTTRLSGNRPNTNKRQRQIRLYTTATIRRQKSRSRSMGTNKRNTKQPSHKGSVHTTRLNSHRSQPMGEQDPMRQSRLSHFFLYPFLSLEAGREETTLRVDMAKTSPIPHRRNSRKQRRERAGTWIPNNTRKLNAKGGHTQLRLRETLIGGDI